MGKMFNSPGSGGSTVGFNNGAAVLAMPIGGPTQAVMTGVFSSPDSTDFSPYETLYTGPTMMEALELAMLSSPFENAEVPSPEDEIAAMESRLEHFVQLVDEMEPDDLDGAVAAAAAAYDAEVAPEARITAAVTAHEQRKTPALLRSIARANATSFGLRAVMGTQHDISIAAVVSENQAETADFAGRLELMHEEKRAEAILRLADAYLGWRTRHIEADRGALAAQMDMAKLAHTMRTDQYEANLEYETLDATWELDRGQQFMNLFTPMNGAPVVPRAQTPRERLMAAVMSSASLGLQAGASMGPAAGIGMGVANLGAQLYAMGR